MPGMLAVAPLPITPADNTTASFLFPIFSGVEYLRVWWLTTAVTYLAAIAVVLMTGPQRLARTAAPAATSMGGPSGANP